MRGPDQQCTFVITGLLQKLDTQQYTSVITVLIPRLGTAVHICDHKTYAEGDRESLEAQGTARLNHAVANSKNICF